MNSSDEKLFKLLASTCMLSEKTRNYHWNVTGPNFYNIHLVLAEQYKELIEGSDIIAERLRALGNKITPDISIFIKNSIIKNGQADSDWVDMISELATDHINLSNFINDIFNDTIIQKDPVTIDILTNRMQSHSKTNWILRSHNN